jgi:hypothetical protein
MRVAQLQESMDKVETILRDDQLPDDIKIHDALEIIADS